MSLALLFVWMAIGAVLRFTHLTTKPLWADEFSTLVFSLGNSFLTIPLDQALSLNQLLQPLQPNPQASVYSVIHNLLSESNHPPLFFVLTHLWLKLFPAENGLVSLWAARSMSVLWGVLSIPATFGLGWLAFRSQRVGQLAAALMALSPFGIYLAQEARHYTLAVLWIIASLSCLVVAVQRLQTKQRLPLWLCLLWIAVNGLGIATHYFFLLTLVAEAIALLIILIFSFGSPIARFPNFSFLQALSPNRDRLFAVAVGTIATALVWLPVVQNIRGAELTRWIRSNEFDNSSLTDQLLRFLAGLVSMVYLVPIQGVPLPVVILSGVVLLGLLGWTGWLLVRGWINLLQHSDRLPLLSLGSFVVAAIGLSLLLTFGLGVNFISVFRYQFFFFPAVIVLLGGILSDWWDRVCPVIPGIKSVKISGRAAIGVILSFSLLGSLTVMTNLGYQKTHRPTEVATAIYQTSEHSALVAIPHKTHGHTGRLMSIAWELRRLNPTQTTTTFLLAHYPESDPQPAIAALERTVASLPRPLTVWRINFRSAANPLSHTALDRQGCTQASRLFSVDGFRYQRYECSGREVKSEE